MQSSWGLSRRSFTPQQHSGTGAYIRPRRCAGLDSGRKGSCSAFISG
jgi:hypothetical protein